MDPNSPADTEDKPGIAADEGSDSQTSDEGQGSSSADSPNADKKDDNKPLDMVAAVRAALDPKEEQSSGSGDGEGESADPNDPNKAKAAEGEDDPAELSDEEFNSLKPKTQRRIKHLIKQAETLSSTLKDMEPKAQGFEKIQDFARKANLSREDVNTGFNIMNLMRNEPDKAYEALLPIWTSLCAIVGTKLPSDLHDQVEKGEITMEVAQELSRARAGRSIRTQKEQEDAKRADENAKEDTAKAQETLRTSVQEALTGWENKWKSSDPDYSLKQGRVMEALELELLRREKQGTLPKTAQEAIALANDLRKKVDTEVKKLVPKRSPSKPVTGIGATSGSQPAPKTLRDAVAQAVGHA